MNKYQLIVKDYLEEDEKFSDKMEELAADYIKEHDLPITVDYLWNDGTAEEARDSLYIASKEDGIFFADLFFEDLIDRADDLSTDLLS